METYVGIWVDHRKALIVTLSGEKESYKKIDSNAEPHFRLSGGYRSTNPNRASVASERKPEERQKHQLKRYYKEVIKYVSKASEILIFGPGESKIELEKETKNVKKLTGRIAGVTPADKMTYRQIAENTKEFFFSKYGGGKDENKTVIG